MTKRITILVVSLVVGATLIVNLKSLTASKTYAVEPILVFNSTTSIAVYISQQCLLQNVSIKQCLAIIEHESQFNPRALGDDELICKSGPNKGKPVHSRGLWQVNDCAWPEVTDDVAFSVVSSTAWAIPHFKQNPWWWSTYKLYKIYLLK